MSASEVDTPTLSPAHPFMGPSVGSESAEPQPIKVGPRRRARFGVAFRLLVSFVAITVFAAASLKNALDDANTAFTRATGVKVVSLHHDISTTTGEMILVFTLAESPLFREMKKK